MHGRDSQRERFSHHAKSGRRKRRKRRRRRRRRRKRTYLIPEESCREAGSSIEIVFSLSLLLLVIFSLLSYLNTKKYKSQTVKQPDR